MLDSAATAARRVNTPAARVTVERAGAVVTVKNNARVAGFLEPCPTRDRIEFNVIAGVYPGAAPATVAGVFCAHALNCHN